MTDQTTPELLDNAVWVDGDPLMEAIAAAVWEHCDTSGGHSIVTDDPRNIAAVAATVARTEPAAAAPLPPADQAAVLRAAADELDARMERFFSEWPDEPKNSPYALGQKDAANELRRMADETATTETQPRRGDAFEAWLKAQRDDCFGHASSWAAVDGLLNQYRLHADTGTSLGEHVCEGQVVGDCECLEQPAAGARQDGASS